MDKSQSLLSPKQKQDITDIFLSIYKQPLNKSFHLITNDIILNGMEVINTETVLKMKMGQFYEQLFCYLCNFIHPRKELDLVNEQEQIFIELKTNFLLDNHNARNSKFHHLGKHKTNNPNAKAYCICLNDKRRLHVN